MLAMKRRVLVGLVPLLMGLVVVAGLGSRGTARAQTSGAGAVATIAALQTEVAELRTDVDALQTQVASLNQGGTGSTASGGTGGLVATPVASIGGSDAAGTRADPIPFGFPAQVGDWTVTVESVEADGTALVMTENQFNDPPEPGEQFVLVRVAGTYEGNETGSFYIDLAYATVGESAVAYTNFGDSCGVVPDEIPITDVFTGGMVSGNICWSVRSEDVASLVMYIEPLFSFDESERVFFALRP